MGFQKKANTSMKTKKFQQKKGKKIPQQIADNADGDSMDGDDSGDSEEQIQTTSFNKTPKGKNEKRMSFKVAGGGSALKATPAKTPQRNSLVPKKPSTPAAKSKGPIQQEFKGMKGKQTKRPAQDDDDDDDDDDEDDDEEDNLDMQGLDMADSDAEDDDDNDDMDEEENDEEDEQHSKKNGKSVNVKLEKQKNAKQTEKLPTPKTETSCDSKKAKKEKGSPARTVALNPEEKKQRDARSLMFKYLPKDVVVEELKKMSPDIQSVFLPGNRFFAPAKTTYAFLQFESEAKAEANLKILRTKRFRGKPLTVTFVGKKSEPKQDQPKQRSYMKKLEICKLPPGTTIAQIAKYFPKARYISFDSPVHRWATICYATETDAADDFNKAKDVNIDGQKVVVQYALHTRVNRQNSSVKNGRFQKDFRYKHSAKKLKLMYPWARQ